MHLRWTAWATAWTAVVVTCILILTVSILLEVR